MQYKWSDFNGAQIIALEGFKLLAFNAKFCVVIKALNLQRRIKYGIITTKYFRGLMGYSLSKWHITKLHDTLMKRPSLIK